MASPIDHGMTIATVDEIKKAAGGLNIVVLTDDREKDDRQYDLKARLNRAVKSRSDKTADVNEYAYPIRVMFVLLGGEEGGVIPLGAGQLYTRR